jgi:hypothetical protein
VLEFTEAAFDTVAQLVQGSIVVPLLFPVGARRNDRLGVHGCLYMGQDGTGIVALVGDDGLGLAAAEQLDGWRVVADVTGLDQEL